MATKYCEIKDGCYICDRMFCDGRNTRKMKNTIFTEDNFHRTLTNLAISVRGIIDYPCGKAERENVNHFIVSTKDGNELSRNAREFEEVSALLHHHFSDQFKHNCKVRRICENPDCHTIYAYFYEDFLYCPKCGTKLTTTRDDRANDIHTGGDKA